MLGEKDCQLQDTREGERMVNHCSQEGLDRVCLDSGWVTDNVGIYAMVNNHYRG